MKKRKRIKCTKLEKIGEVISKKEFLPDLTVNVPT